MAQVRMRKREIEIEESRDGVVKALIVSIQVVTSTGFQAFSTFSEYLPSMLPAGQYRAVQ